MLRDKLKQDILSGVWAKGVMGCIMTEPLGLRLKKSGIGFGRKMTTR